MVIQMCNTSWPNIFVISIILLVRILSVFVVRSSFVPDEYWQSLEVAHKTAFGYGHLTWEWQKKIRSYAYPSIFYVLYCILPESVGAVVFIPKIFQAILSSIGDFFAYKLSCKLFGSKSGYWTLLNILTSWFLFYCSSRTLTNMSETSFTTCGLFFYPWNSGKRKGLVCSYLWFAGASTLMRPTAAILWLPLYLYHLWREKDYIYMLRKTLFIGCAILVILMCCDRYFYGEWVLTPFNFFLYNWTNDIGAFYGQHNFLWYFYAGFPVIMGIHLIPFLLGLSLPYLRRFYLLVLWMISVFSLLSHKEFRFLLPVLPLSLIICGAVMNEISSKRLIVFKLKVNRLMNIILICTIMLINIPFSLYMGLVHQHGTIDATSHLSGVLKSTSSVLFLMPCHSTPYYSYIHQNVSMKFLSCEPNFNNLNDYMDEADIFFENPELWLIQNYEQNHLQHVPSHVVMFDTLHPRISKFLEKYKYSLCYQTFHSHFPESKTGQYVLIYCR